MRIQDAVPPFRPEARGFASGEGLNCLLNSILQHQYNIRRGYDTTSENDIARLDTGGRELRGVLSASGVVPARGEIDIYSGVGAYLTQSLHVRLQVIQQESLDLQGERHVRYIPHPVPGNAGDLIRLLHTPGHFQPLWD